MLINLFHGLAGVLEGLAKQSTTLKATLEGLPEKIRLLYDKEKIASLVLAAVAEADTDRDGKISEAEWIAWFPKGISTALGSTAAILEWNA